MGLGSTPDTIRSLNYCPKNKTEERNGLKIRMKVVPENVDDLARFCKTFEEMFKHPLEYKGDGLSGLMQRAFTALAVTRRKLFNDEDRNAVKLRQDGKCAKCQDPIVRFEVDHITPLCQGGSNEPSNLQALCKPCHADKTQTEERSGTRIHTVESHMSPKLWRDLHKAPKPAQICWGLFETSSQLQEKNCRATSRRWRTTQTRP